MPKYLKLLIVMLCFVGCGFTPKYDLLVDKDETCNQKWSDYDSTLQRRADLIPQMVAIVQGSAHHEQNTLTAVIQARANATRPEIKLDPRNDDLSDPVKFAAFQQAQAQLGTAIGKLMMVQEKYPELQANKQFSDLMTVVEGAENRILRAREEYNKAAQSYNTELRHISGKIVNPITGHEFKPREYFKADEGAKAAPVISFDNAAPPSTVAPVTAAPVAPAPIPVPVAAPAPTIIVVPQYQQPYQQPQQPAPQYVPQPNQLQYQQVPVAPVPSK